MSLLDPDPKEEQEVQRALVAFAENSVGLILYHCGKNIACEIEQLGYCPDELGILDCDSPDHGIWVWEGTFRYWKDYEGEWDVDMTTIQWRKPTVFEWIAIQKGENPFNLTKPNLNGDLFKKEMVAEFWMKKDSYFQFEDRDKVRAKLIAMDRGRVVSECPKCKSRVEGKHCTSCGYFCE